MFVHRTRRLLAGLALCIPAGLLCGCVAAENTVDTTSTQTIQPRVAAYACDDDTVLTVESLGSSVRVIETEGSSIDLPASPPAQNARFGGENRALVIESGEALYMVSGEPVRTCQQT